MIHLDMENGRGSSLKGNLGIGIVVCILVLSLMFVFSCEIVSASPASAPEYSQSEQAYLISNLEELNYIREDLDNDYVLIDDVDASSVQSWDNGRGWEPIGSKNDPFNGDFKGNGYEIKDIYIDRSQSEYIGLFGVVGNKGKVSDITLVDVEFSGSRNVGGLVGYLKGEVSQASVSGFVNGSTNVGGVVGYNLSNLNNSSSSANIEGGRMSTGGLVGFNANGSIVKMSYAIGSVKGKLSVGGLVGYNGQPDSDSEKARISSSYAMGDVVGNSEVGGLVGTNFSNIEISYARGDVEGGKYVGGLVGGVSPYASVDESYSTGRVYGENKVGGFTGYKNFKSEVTDSYWDEDASMITDSQGGVGLDNVSMKGRSARDTMEGFDFNDTWDVVDGRYPVLSSLKESSGSGSDTGSVTDYVSYYISNLSLLLIF